jgi:hypothetical protein
VEEGHERSLEDVETMGRGDAPIPVDIDNPTATETAAMKAFEVRYVSAFMEISLVRTAN